MNPKNSGLKQKKPATNDTVLYDSIYVKCLEYINS